MRRTNIKNRFRELLTTLLSEGRTPGRASAAVFTGIFIGVVPIYGLQSIVAVGLASLFRLNKLLTFAATFVNNFFFQPFLVLFSIATGYLILEGELLTLSSPEITEPHLKGFFSYFVFGSIIFGTLLGFVGATITFFVVTINSRRHEPRRLETYKTKRFIKGLYKDMPLFERSFVKWKVRLDKLFSIIAAEDLGKGPALDLGCGYGLGLAVVAAKGEDRELVGCDIDKHKIEIARKAFNAFDAKFYVADIRDYKLQPVGLIMILDVLQYLKPEQQIHLLYQCCDSLLPGGKLIFRVQDQRKGILSWLTYKLDQLILWFERNNERPNPVNISTCRTIMKEKGLVTKELTFINKLPLAHILFYAEKVI